MLITLRKPVGNVRIFIHIRIRILHGVQSADPHYTRSRICHSEHTHSSHLHTRTDRVHTSHVHY